MTNSKKIKRNIGTSRRLAPFGHVRSITFTIMLLAVALIFGCKKSSTSPNPTVFTASGKADKTIKVIEESGSIKTNQNATINFDASTGYSAKLIGVSENKTLALTTEHFAFNNNELSISEAGTTFIKDNGSWKLFISDFNTFELPKEKSFREKMKEMKDLIPPKKICMGIAVFGVLAYCVSNFLLKKFKDENKILIKVKKDNNKTDKEVLKKYLLKNTIFQSCLCAIINTGLALCNLRTTKNIYSKLLGAGLSSGALWMIFSLISDKKTLNQFKKENKQEV